MWIAARSGALLNLDTATRVYIDARGRLLVAYLSGDVEALPAGADAASGLAAIRAAVPRLIEMPAAP